MINFKVEDTAQLKLGLHLAISFSVLVAFILTIARIANNGSSRGRSTLYGIPVVRTRADFVAFAEVAFQTIKSAIFLAYQNTTEHFQRLRRWRSLKAYMILNHVETLFWAVLFGLSAQGSIKGCNGSACTLAGVLAAVSFLGCIVAALLAFVCTMAWLFLRRHDREAGAKPVDEVRERMKSKVSVGKYEYPSV